MTVQSRSVRTRQSWRRRSSLTWTGSWRPPTAATLPVPIEVGEDRRWSAADTERLFKRMGRTVPTAPTEQRLTDVLAEAVRLQNALRAWLASPAEESPPA